MILTNKTQFPRIAFSHYSAKNDISGVTSWLERLLLRLHSEGIPVSVYLQHIGSDIKDSRLFHTIQQAGIPVEIELNSYTETDVRGTLAFLNRHQPQVFLPQCREAMFYAATIAGQAGLAWGLTIHSDDPVYWAITEIVSPESNGGLMIGVSDYICQKAIQKGLVKQSQTIPCGVPIPGNTSTFSDKPFRVAFCGRIIEEQKRISLVLEAMAQASYRDTRVECWVIGDGPAISESQQWVTDQGLSDRIYFLGQVEPSTVQANLTQCQALLLMSDYEGLPVAVLEAMAVGVVPIVRDIPSGIPELIKNNETGLLVGRSPKEAANAIIYLADHPDLWSKLSNTSKLLVAKNYSEEICYQRWLDMISELHSRSSISYPIPIAKKISLPPLHKALIGRDIREPQIGKLSQVKNKVKTFLLRFKKSA
jgi:colanic acid/amylovoran biosynthesis glycosyltransferase